MRLIRSFFSNVPKYLLWAVLSTMFWLWILTFVTDTSADKKVTLYAEVPVLADPDLAVALEEGLPSGLRMVKARSPNYYMFGSIGMDEGDFYVLPASAAGEYIKLYQAIDPADYPDAPGFYERGGVCYGVKVYDAATETGAALQYVHYTKQGETPEDYYLFYRADSLHCGSQDNAAYDVAAVYLRLP